MGRDAQGERRWPVLIWALALGAAPFFALLINQLLPAAASPWFELRDFALLLVLPVLFGVISETGLFRLNALEARDAAIVLTALVLIAWFSMLLLGWGFDPVVTLAPFAMLLVVGGGFFAGRWAGRRRRPSLSDGDGP